MKYFSIIIPVYNRPDELDELLESLTRQTYADFEVVIIEDGSVNRADEVVEKYHERLSIHYYFKPNSGQGFSRNYGFERATGEYLLVFDSDCVIPPDYLQIVKTYLSQNPLDAYGGPDRAHPDFTTLQKAISYSMTSPFTTGGIRGARKRIGEFHPRSFNMGITREVFRKTGGYRITRMGEDIELSIRIIAMGFRTGLIEEAFVYHKRRTSLKEFFRQLHFFGRARINVGRFYPGEVKLIHTFPAIFTIGLIIWLFSWIWFPVFFIVGTTALLLFTALIFFHALITTGEVTVAIFSVAAAFVQLTAYGIGFLTEGWRRLMQKSAA